ncbi:valine--tRNA ligase [Candidatus Woesearchaeota archaeon]|nr:MAG: valine--tRNA ligase [Candidatus Woesearchaeota archaeon]
MKLADIKHWTPEVEKEITTRWRALERFRFTLGTKPIYSIDTPPPYINAPIHLGHATTYSYMDFFARYKRMRGFDVLFPLGLDRNGLPIELSTEKKYNITPHKIGRESFIEACEKMLNETGEESVGSFADLGISFTSYQHGKHIGAVYHTDSPEYRALTQATFVNLYLQGIIYEDTRINNWDPKLQTTIADSEIEYHEIPSTFNHVKWKVKETGEEIIIGTTRPELICTCAMVIYNPEDSRYKHLAGKHAITPLFGKEVPIKEHPFASIEKGSGLVMMCSAGDTHDIQFFREQKLKPTIAIEKNGKMNDHAGFLAGLKVKDARAKIIEELNAQGLLAKQENIVHRTPVSERSKAEVEFIEMPEFYLRQQDCKEDLLALARKMKFYPENARKLLEDWIHQVSIDWPISRRRYYATPIPLWHSDGKIAVPPPGKYYVPWKEQPPADSTVLENGKKTGTVRDFPSLAWTGETRVLDTWFDSSISELYVLQYKRNDEFFAKAYPATLRPQGKEIVRTWLYYTLLRGHLETKKACFKDVWIHQHITDEQGRKMSKSLGNVIDPQKIIAKHGAEALRLWAAIEGNLAKGDLRCSEEKISAEVKTINKLINVAKFVLQFEKPKKTPALTATDQLFIDFLENITALAEENYEQYDFFTPMLKLRNFLWEIFASHYLELVKGRAYNRDGEFSAEESDSARHALYRLLERWITLCHPIIPQATSTIGEALGIDLHACTFPSAKQGTSDLAQIDEIAAFNTHIWKLKKEKGISLNSPLEGITIPANLGAFAKDLKACHKL